MVFAGIEGGDHATVAGEILGQGREQLAVWAIEGPAGEHVDGAGVVQVAAVVHTSDNRRLVHPFSQEWQVFADVDAWGGGCHGLEFAAHFSGSGWLHVEGIDVAGATIKKHKDAGTDGICLGHGLALRPGAPKPAQIEPQKRTIAQTEEAPSIQKLEGGKGSHGRISFSTFPATSVRR